MPPFWLLLALAAMLALHHWAPTLQWLAAPWRWLGAVPAACGIVITGHAALAFRRADTPLVPFHRSTALVTGGLYRYTRNPMYLGMAAFLLGMAIMLGSITALLPVALFMLVIEYRFIRPEELFLETLFGEDYRTYRERVRRWL